MLADVCFARIHIRKRGFRYVGAGNSNQQVLCVDTSALAFGTFRDFYVSNIIEHQLVGVDVLGTDEERTLSSIIRSPPS